MSETHLKREDVKMTIRNEIHRELYNYCLIKLPPVKVRGQKLKKSLNLASSRNKATQFRLFTVQIASESIVFKSIDHFALPYAYTRSWVVL